MHIYSFDFRDPAFILDRWNLSFQIITLENVYGLDPAHTTVEENAGGWDLHCTALRWAGQQRTAPGTCEVRARRDGEGRLRLSVRATAPHKIRVVKVILRDLPPLAMLDMLDEAHDIPAEGVVELYPNRLRLPVCFLRPPDAATIGLRSEDLSFRSKRFAIYQERFGPFADRYAVECIHEEDARWFDRQIEVPDWVLAQPAAVEAFRDEQLAFYEHNAGLARWEARRDTPDWARDIRLCLILHGMHWSGYTFNTYSRMLETIRYAAARIDGRRILAYLPGWEGRYYWQYGDYRPEPMLGGEEGFRQLCDEARALGVHVMPMFGVNCVNAWAPNFHEFGPSSYMKSATRNIFLGNQPDWDMARAGDTGWQAWLNPGAPAWQTELTRQILTLVDRFGFDGVFLDTAEVRTNDPDFNVREGLQQIMGRLRQDHPDLLVTAEDWWDGLLSIFPIFQQTSKWRQVPPWVGRYARLIGHICDGDPGRNSTGVFESGYSPYYRLPDTETYIASLAFVEDTLEKAQSEIDAVIALAAARS